MQPDAKKLLWLITIIPIAIIISICSRAIAHTHKIEWISKPCIKPITRYDYSTCSDMEVFIDGTMIAIPRGFITDLASIPRILWPVLAPQYSGFVYPAILHDFLYRCPDNVTRRYADDILYNALLVEGVSHYTATKFWLAVRIFGGEHFDQVGNCNFDYIYQPPAYNEEVDND